MNIKALIVILTCLTFYSQTAAASTAALDASVLSGTRFATEDMPSEQRRTLAKAGLDYWQDFQGRIPRVSPNELVWLQAEFSSNDSNRIFRASTATTYALDRLTAIAETCVTAFRNLTAVDHQSIKLIELYYWTKSLYCYSNPTLLLEYLKTTQLSDGRWDGPFNIRHFVTFHNTVTGPLANSIANEQQEGR